jgi:hypothetical protein
MLRILADGAEHSQRELADQIADHFELLHTGKRPLYESR